MNTQPQIGRITIAPGVLETVARLTALAVPGVARLVSPPGVRRLLQQDRVKLEIVEDSVRVELHVVVEPRASMINIAHHIQGKVTRAIHDIVGMEVQSVDVHIVDVAYPSNQE